MNINQTTFLFIFPKATSPAKADNAPISKASASVSANPYPLDNAKKLMTWIVLTTLTTSGTNRNEMIINQTILFDFLFSIF